MKFIAFSDLHLHGFASYAPPEVRLNNCLKAVLKVFSTAQKRGANVLFCGDWFDRAKAIPIQELVKNTKLMKLVESKFPGIDMYCVSGNHDYQTKPVLGQPLVSSLQYMEGAFPFVKLVDNQILELGGLQLAGVPYYYHAQEYYKAVQQVASKLKPKDEAGYSLLITHATAIGFSDMGFEGVVNPRHECFRDFDLVLSGDIHKKRIFEAVKGSTPFIMLGNPLAKDPNDKDDEKGCWFLDTETGDVEFIPLGFPTFEQRTWGVDAEQDEGDYSVYIQWQYPMPEPESTDNKQYQVSNSQELLDTIEPFVESQKGEPNSDLSLIGKDVLRNALNSND